MALIRRRRAGHFPDRAYRPHCPARPNASDAQHLIGILYVVRCILLFQAIRHGDYETVEGVCIAIRRAPIGGHQRIRLMDDSGAAHDLLLDRHQKFLIGSSYRVYLQSPPGAELPEARIPRGALLGLEELGACRAESEIDGQPAAPEGPNIAEMEKFNE